MPLTANIVESFNITQQKNSSSNIFPHSLTVALNLTIQDYFLLNQNKELSTEELLNHVWKNDLDANSEVVWIYVSYLRQKLQSIQSSVRIEGDKGGSYKLVK